MAQVTVRETVVREADEIGQVLKPLGVEYDRWPTGALPSCVADQEALDAEEKQVVLASLSTDIQRLIDTKGYRTADIVVLSPATPNLESLLQTFRQEHYHTEDEVRFVVDGEGVFYLRSQDDVIYQVLVQKGDLIIVPAGMWHWFDLTEQRRIKCVRIFQTTEGWQALFREQSMVG